MSEKFRKIVHSPEEAAAKLRKKIGATRPVEYVRARATGDKLNAGAVAGIAALGTAKWSAWLAAEKYTNMLSLYPNNALLRNDLAATYNKLGMYNDAITQVREIVHRIGDKGQYAAAYYNAGFAYEKLGNLQKALANYKLALANGNRRVQRDITRVRENMNKVSSQGKRMAFSGARAKLQNKSRGDLLVYGIEHKGNMA